MRLGRLHFVVKHVHKHAITFTHIMAFDERDAESTVRYRYKGTNVIYTKLEGAN